MILQIDGTICPQTTAIVPGLAKGENGSPYTSTTTPANVAGAGPKGPIDPVFEADEQPQVFAIPQTNGKYNTINFIDLLEGAGYENTFGWYNVGDDLSNLSNLYPVLTCAGTNYEPTGNTKGRPSSLSVDFEAEKTAGRYKGGFVGFFLVTPEGYANANNECIVPTAQRDAEGNTACGNPTAAGGNCVGRIYYTEKQINGDGNYVHYLIYQSKRTDAAGKRANDFYFGFEDLYRGGDNDFEDMLILVQGLVVPCVPSAEICDGKDNNCDGLVDNSPTDVNVDCYSGPAGTQGVGVCKAGKTVCASTGPGDTTKTCVGAVVPSAETCDGKDNNCNGQVDDNVSNLPNACGPQNGSCTASTQCVGGAPKCVVATGPKVEICNGIDDDCDGVIDNNVTDAGNPCTPTGNDPVKGECKAGTSVCSAGKLVCQGYKGPSAEICDGKDNNCDGTVDNSPTDLLAKCAPSGVNVCTSGAEQCINGAKVCSGFTLPAPETCNGKDDDCNGKIDDNTLDTGAQCGNNVGQCKAGTIACVTGALVCQGGVGPSAEICDGLDNNCNGQVDEGSLPGVGTQCSPQNGSTCKGTNACKNGVLLCIGTGGTAEVCDGIDNDCNGVIDDNLTDIGALCGNNVGQCTPGVFTCVPATPGDLTTDKLICQGGVSPGSEVCDGVDNDCNGFIDDNVPGVGVACGGDGCGAGKTVCDPIAKQIICKTSGGTGKPETCNGKDDDCNGLIDDNPIDVDAPCGISTGQCLPGVFKCLPTVEGDPTTDQKTCVGGQGPVDEICDGKDNDCDGKTDEDPDNGKLPGVGDDCTQPGQCGKGVQACKNGALVCVSTGQTSPEICDGIDNDCDGEIDENTTDAGVPCGTSVGECKQGISKCVAGKLECEGEVKGTDEVCDGKDNNCNGVTDEDPDGAGPLTLDGAGEDCAPDGLTLPLQGECKPGKTVCFGGKFVCIGAVGPTVEACDGKDNDCNGTVDSPNPCPGEAICLDGQCAQKCTQSGEFTTCPGGTNCIDGYCRSPGGTGGSAGAGGMSAGGMSAGGANAGGMSAGGANAGGANAGGANAGGANAGGTSVGGANAGGANAGGANAGGAAGNGVSGQPGKGANGGQASGVEDSDGDGKADEWGLATGGGGCAYGPSGRVSPWAGAGVMALLAAVVGRRRQRRGQADGVRGSKMEVG